MKLRGPDRPGQWNRWPARMFKHTCYNCEMPLEEHFGEVARLCFATGKYASGLHPLAMNIGTTGPVGDWDNELEWGHTALHSRKVRFSKREAKNLTNGTKTATLL